MALFFAKIFASRFTCQEIVLSNITKKKRWGMDAFELTEKAQQAIAEVYAALSNRFRETPDLRALFLMLAEEERRHLHKVRSLGEAWRAEGDYWQPMAEMHQLLGLVERTEEALAALFTRPNLLPQQAFQIAGELEGYFERVHQALIDSEDEPQIQELFELLKEHGPGHQELFARLKQGSTERSPAARRRHDTLTRGIRAPVLEVA